jgi:tRNA nucleotidyltransferase/poly(A) polymerase
MVHLRRVFLCEVPCYNRHLRSDLLGTSMRQSFVPNQKALENPIYRAALHVCSDLQRAGFEAYFVGGSVRDLILRPDWDMVEVDIATSALPADVTKVFPGSFFVGKAFGVALVKKNDIGFEVTTFRKEGQYSDRRHPDSIEPGTLEEDSNRRDFTVNSLYFDPTSQTIVDLHAGLRDLNAKVLRCVGDAEARLHEDSLRIIRLFRFAANFGFELEAKTLAAAVSQSDGVLSLSRERIVKEIVKVLPQKFEAFAALLFKNLPLNHLDAMLANSELQHVHGNTFAPTTHQRVPVVSLCHEALRRSQDTLLARELCWVAFQRWPLEGDDKSTLKLLCYDLSAIFKHFESCPDDDRLHFLPALFLKSVRTAERLLVSDLNASLELFSDVFPKCLQHPFLAKWMSVLAQETVGEFISSRIKTLPMTSEQIGVRVQTAGKALHFIGGWNLWQEAEALSQFFQLAKVEFKNEGLFFTALEKMMSLQKQVAAKRK